MLKLDTVIHACRIIEQEVRDAYKELSLHYIVYHKGQNQKALEQAEQNMSNHPAKKEIGRLLKTLNYPEQSKYLGAALVRKKIFGGLSSIDTLFALCVLNIDQYSDIKDVRAYAYHFSWHALDVMNVRKGAIYKGRQREGVIFPKTGLLDVAAANLRADVFSAVMCALHDDKNSAGRIALKRGKDALSKHIGYRSEEYPFIIALEATEFAIGEYLKTPISKKQRIFTALKIAGEVGSVFDAESLKHWIGFAAPAQDMLWRRYGAEKILGSAIYVSQSTPVRSTGHLVSEITGIKPVSIQETGNEYSAYADSQSIAELHERTVERVFEDVMVRGLEENSSYPFTEEAYRQNEALAEGRVLGWCASALQAAAETFKNTITEGKESAEKAANHTFQRERSKMPWGELKKLGKKIVQQSRSGHSITPGAIVTLCKNTPQYAPVMSAINAMPEGTVLQEKL